MSRCTMPAVGLADLGDRFAGDEVHDLVDFQRFVRLAPTEDGNVEHGHRSRSDQTASVRRWIVWPTRIDS